MLKKILISLYILQLSLFSLEIIGNYENIDLQEFSIFQIPAKVDTGARISSLHCSYIEKQNGDIVAFKPIKSDKIFYKKIHRVVSIKSSNGQSESRYTIITTVYFNKKPYEIEFSLSNRNLMQYKILLGTNFIENRFLIDVSKQILKD